MSVYVDQHFIGNCSDTAFNFGDGTAQINRPRAGLARQRYPTTDLDASSFPAEMTWTHCKQRQRAKVSETDAADDVFSLPRRGAVFQASHSSLWMH